MTQMYPGSSVFLGDTAKSETTHVPATLIEFGTEPFPCSNSPRRQPALGICP